MDMIFDFDGVIVDSFELNYAIACNFYNLTKDEYKSWFNGNIYDTIAKKIERYRC